jgi:hypothetical protein
MAKVPTVLFLPPFSHAIIELQNFISDSVSLVGAKMRRWLDEWNISTAY